MRLKNPPRIPHIEKGTSKDWIAIMIIIVEGGLG